MKQKTLITGLAIFAVVAMAIFVTMSGGSSEQPKQEQEVSITQNVPQDLPSVLKDVIERKDEEGVVILDVRTPAEWAEGHVTGATLWGLEERIKQGELPDVAKDSEIYIYCRSGNRAGQAVSILADEGYTNLTNIGGFADWQRAGGPSE